MLFLLYESLRPQKDSITSKLTLKGRTLGSVRAFDRDQVRFSGSPSALVRSSKFILFFLLYFVTSLKRESNNIPNVQLIYVEILKKLHKVYIYISRV